MQNLNEYYSIMKGRTINDSYTAYLTLGVGSNGATCLEHYSCPTPNFDGSCLDNRIELFPFGTEGASIKIIKNHNSVSYRFLTTYEKPLPSSYKATENSTLFTINIGGIGSAITIYNTAGMAFVTEAGAICKEYNSTSVYGLPASKCKFNNGVLTIACTDKCVNNTGNHYYQVL